MTEVIGIQTWRICRMVFRGACVRCVCMYLVGYILPGKCNHVPLHLISCVVILQVMPLDVATTLWRASVPVSSLFNAYDMMNQDVPSSQPTRKLRRLEVTVQCLRWMGEGNQVRYWLDYFWWGIVTALFDFL